MSGGSQHNPNGRQSQLGAAWSPLQLQVASLLARAPQAHMASERGVTWHTPTPPPHLYHVPAPSPPDPLQAMKGAGAVFRHMVGADRHILDSARHSATPPDLYRHTPTPPDKHLMSRHTPSPGDMKAAVMPPVDLFPHLGVPNRDKLPRGEELLSLARGVDLSVGARGPPAPAHAAPAPAHAGPPALSVRDAPTINSLIARAQPRAGAARVDSLLERLGAPVSPHSVIVHARPDPPSPHSSEDSADSCGAPPGSKRKRKPERTIRVPMPPVAIPPRLTPPAPLENGDSHHKHNGPQTQTQAAHNTPEHKTHEPEPEQPPQKIQTQNPPSPPPPEPHARRKSRSGSSETIDDIAAMIKNPSFETHAENPPVAGVEAPVTIDKLKSVLASTEAPSEGKEQSEEADTPPAKAEEKEKQPESLLEAAAAPKRRSTRTSNSESTNVPVESPSEGKPAEACEEPLSGARTAEGTSEPTAAFVEVENQLEMMFAGLEEEPKDSTGAEKQNRGKKRRKSAPTKTEAKAGRRSARSATGDGRRKRGGGKRGGGRKKSAKEAVREYDSGSNASSGRSRGPYIQIRGPRDSPLSVSVINASTGEDDAEAPGPRRKDEFRNGMRVRGLHQSTLGLRYDATTPDATWLCAFCERGPHAAGLGDLFGPYTADTDCDEYRTLDEATRHRYSSLASPGEVWTHEACAVWAPGLVAGGARLWGLAAAVWGARRARCSHCQRQGAGVACHARGCLARTHVPCATAAKWSLDEAEFRALCPRHAPA